MVNYKRQQGRPCNATGDNLQLIVYCTVITLYIVGICIVLSLPLVFLVYNYFVRFN